MEGKWDYTRNVIIEFPTYEKALEEIADAESILDIIDKHNL